MNSTQQQITQLSNTALSLAQPYYYQIQRLFILYTHDMDFILFCIAYSILLIFIISSCCTKRAWRPKNKQLKTFKQAMKQNFYSFLFSLPLLKSYVNNKFQQSLDKQQVKIIHDLHKHWDSRRMSSLPAQGMNDDNLRKRIYQWSQNQKAIWNTGKISGAFYVQNEQHMNKMNDFAAMYLYHNPLHLDTYKQLIRMQKQILDMTNTMITNSDKTYFGTVTSGGSQSLILALYAYRTYYKNRTQTPNIVIPVTAHAAIDKGCFYLNIQARKCKLNDEFQADVSHMESLIDKNTIMLMASVPNYPHGIIDPVDKICKLAKKYKVGCHLDGCLGGFVGAFHNQFKQLYSLDREGATSISLDHHKFGLAPKGLSTIFYKTAELRQAQYYVNSEWKGGLYGTMTFPGSRSGFASAAGWYSLTQTTLKGFKQNAKNIIQATQQGAKKLRQIKGIQVFGDPKLCVISFTTTQPNCPLLGLADFLSNEKKWNLSTLHKPYGIHISVTHANIKNVIQKYPKDIEQGLKMLRASKKAKQSLASAIYGSAAKIPTDGMEHDMLKLLLAASLK